MHPITVYSFGYLHPMPEDIRAGRGPVLPRVGLERGNRAMTPDIISAIDNATGCHQCGKPLGGSPSSDFCSEYCQRKWAAGRVQAPEEPKTLADTFREVAISTARAAEALRQLARAAEGL